MAQKETLGLWVVKQKLSRMSLSHNLSRDVQSLSGRLGTWFNPKVVKIRLTTSRSSRQWTFLVCGVWDCG